MPPANLTWNLEPRISTRVLRSAISAYLASYASPRTRHACARLPGLPLRVSFTADVHPGALKYGLCAHIHIPHTHALPPSPTLIHTHPHYTHTHTQYIYMYIYIYVCIYALHIYIYILIPLGSGSVLLDPPRRARILYALRGPLDCPSRSRPPPSPLLLRRRPTEEGDPHSPHFCDLTLELQLPCPALDTLIRPIRPPHDGLCFLLSSGS